MDINGKEKIEYGKAMQEYYSTLHMTHTLTHSMTHTMTHAMPHLWLCVAVHKDHVRLCLSWEAYPGGCARLCNIPNSVKEWVRKRSGDVTVM